jgi:hypothetical protein
LEKEAQRQGFPDHIPLHPIQRKLRQSTQELGFRVHELAKLSPNVLYRDQRGASERRFGNEDWAPIDAGVEWAVRYHGEAVLGGVFQQGQSFKSRLRCCRALKEVEGMEHEAEVMLVACNGASQFAQLRQWQYWGIQCLREERLGLDAVSGKSALAAFLLQEGERLLQAAQELVLGFVQRQPLLQRPLQEELGLLEDDSSEGVLTESAPDCVQLYPHELRVDAVQNPFTQAYQLWVWLPFPFPLQRFVVEDAFQKPDRAYHQRCMFRCCSPLSKCGFGEPIVRAGKRYKEAKTLVPGCFYEGGGCRWVEAAGAQAERRQDDAAGRLLRHG